MLYQLSYLGAPACRARPYRGDDAALSSTRRAGCPSAVASPRGGARQVGRGAWIRSIAWSVGAGVVGLAIGRALAQAGREVIILEAAEAIGTGISSAQHDVIHAGIYYPKDSLMARFCVAGKRALYQFCADHGVPHKNCGKLIVATNGAEAGNSLRFEARARGEWRRGSPLSDRGRGAGAGAGVRLQWRAALAIDRNRRFASSDAGAARGMRRRSARALASTRRSSAGARERRGLHLRIGGAEPMTLALPAARQRSGPRSAPLIARNIAGMPQEAVPTRLLRQRQLLHPDRAGRPSPISSIRCPSPAASACT